MGVVKNQKKNKTKNEIKKTEEVNGKTKKDENKVKKKKKVSCLQCIKSHDDGGLEGKYRVAAPELMQDTFMSDSEDEGGEVECPIQQQQQYRYMASEAGTLQRARPLAADHTVADGHLWPSNNDKKVATIERQPVDIGFLVSFVVDARGGAMKAKRRGGVRIIVPPAACAAPTRVTCRAATRRAPAAAPPPLMEGEALASRLLELQPQGAKFLAPVIIEVPIFTASCAEREIVVLRSDTGDTWQDHYLHHNDNPLIQEALVRERQEYGPSGEALGESGERVTRVVTCDFPHYLAVVSRVRQEVHVIGPEGGTVSSAHIPQVQALFPPQALTKRIRVGLQAHGAAAELCRRVLPRHAAVSPVLTVEPRRRKFHRSITLTVPLPQQGAVHDKASTATLRLLCSIMGGQARAVWEDVTGSTPLTLTEDCASFTTTVSARFWLMNCQNVSDATKLATELYKEMLLVPFEVRIVVLGKRLDALEGRLLVLYITDRYAYDTLLKQEHYTEIAHSTAVRFLDSKEVFLEFSGNLVPVTKSGSQPMFTFEAFKDNRVEFTVRVKHHEESPAGRLYFMNDPKVAKGEQSQTPACVLDVQLPDSIAPRAKSHADCLNLDQSGFDALKDELSFHWGDPNNSLGPASLPGQGHQLNGHDKIITNGNVKYPTSDGEDKDTKPQVNGGSLHVDSNKTKATFDSDEDKTPMNTLEKGKKKPEGGSFFGGIADKVKNVFNYSDDKDEDVKESSPKPEPPQPQPKPRETKEKEKTPPKPAPRLITEDLLEKVDDMFKDIKHKPHMKDEDELDSHIYSTKLIVDEESDRPSGLDNITEEVYQQYENMQPVETPGCCKTSDPFQFYTGCCEGKYKKGQKHRHDETSNLVDRVEQINFTAHEKLDDLSDKVQNNINDGLNKIEEEKDGIKQKTIEASEDIIEKTDALKKGLKEKGDEWKFSIDEKAKESENALNDQLNKLNQRANDKKQAIQTSIEAEIENAKSSTKDTLSQLAETTNLAKSKLEDKVHEVDFATRERAEQLRLAGQDKINNLETNISNARNAANEKSKDLSNTLNNVQENLNNNVQDLKNDLKTNVNNAKDKTKEKMNDVNDAVNNAKDKVQKAAADTKAKAGEKKDQIETEVKKKKKEGKNFFTGLVHNIFGEKDKIENEIKEKASETQEYTEQLVKQASDKKDEISEKIAEGRESAERLAKEQKDKAKEKITEAKETADELIQKASSKKDDIEQNLKKKKVEISENIEHVVQATEDKKDEVQQALRNKKDEAEKAFINKANEIKGAVDDKKNEFESTVEDKLDSLRHTKDEVQSEAKSQLERIWQEAVQTTEEIKKSGETLATTAANKKSDLQNNVSDKMEQLKESGKDEIVSVQNAASDKLNDLQESTLSAFDKVESAAKEKANAAKESWEDVQSSARDTYADMRDDVTSLESSAQDTLHSFQSSAGNTFDSLDESVKEYVSGASNTLQNAENNSKELFGDVKNTFEGFQISADNKLEDVKTSAKNSLEDAGARLGETKEAVKEDLRGAEESVMNTVSSGADKLASGFEAVGNFALGAFDQGVKKDSSTKLLESEKAQSSPHKKSSGIPKLKRKK